MSTYPLSQAENREPAVYDIRLMSELSAGELQELKYLCDQLFRNSDEPMVFFSWLSFLCQRQLEIRCDDRQEQHTIELPKQLWMHPGELARSLRAVTILLRSCFSHEQASFLGEILSDLTAFVAVHLTETQRKHAAAGRL